MLPSPRRCLHLRPCVEEFHLNTKLRVLATINYWIVGCVSLSAVATLTRPRFIISCAFFFVKNHLVALFDSCIHIHTLLVSDTLFV